MKLFPITFSDEMVKAIRADAKTQTRRVVKGSAYAPCPFGKPGDYLYVREEIIAIPVSYTHLTLPTNREV